MLLLYTIALDTVTGTKNLKFKVWSDFNLFSHTFKLLMYTRVTQASLLDCYLLERFASDTGNARNSNVAPLLRKYETSALLFFVLFYVKWNLL